MSDAATLCEALQHTAATRGPAPALHTVQGDALTWAEYAERVASVAAGLHGLGVRHGDTVALMLTNRPEFHVVDCAAFHLGAIPFSLYNTLPPDQLTDVLTRARARVLVTERRFLPVLRASLAGTDVEHLIAVDGPGDGATDLAAVEAAAPTGFDFAEAWQRVRPDDVLTLIHTSGTTGRSKAVEITHAGMAAQLDATEQLLGITHEDSHLSFLPAAHIADRWASHYTNLRFGTRLTCVPDLKELPGALTSVRPTLFGAVPAVWQRLKAGLDAALAEADPGLRALVEGCIATARRLGPGRRAGTLTAEETKELDEAEPVLAELRKRIGLDRARVCVTGAAPASAELVGFFHAIGVPLGDAWGMSELSGMALMNPPGDLRPGTVGRPVPGARIRVAEDGELLVSAPFLMRGYRDEPELTARVLDSDGWLHTGDVVTVDDDGNVRVVDRKKDIIINTGGKNMSPTRIETVLRDASPLIGHVVVVGDGRPHNVALILPDHEAVTAGGGSAGLDGTIAAAVEDANTRLSRPERIRAHAVLRDVWEPGGPQLTVTLKVRRGAVEQRYAQLIESLYGR
ncbi:AMP-dependent synthetase/ligase [Streptomyces flavidovirens]|uniref:AMP-dependent synthetase/ligase n=1 Tax=Streptomyces flavidovirens TaxID=67298 RepID=UPI0004262C31|nr:AMP-dependent synthetase/ligase [Streptomyces flavidovirens]